EIEVVSVEEEMETSPEVEEEEDFPQTMMFSLDDDFEEDEKEDESVSVQPAVKAVKPEVKKEIEPENPFDSPISESLSHAIEERRARLKQFNYKFKNTLQNKSMDEVESITAYKRKGLELNEREDNSPSDYVISKDSNNETKIRPNNFLHDNVD